MKRSVAERFYSKIEQPANGGACWVWAASTNTAGYGQFSIKPGNPRNFQAHRLSWEMHRGPIPNGLQVLHRCDNCRCVNPDHLFLGTPLDNVLDRNAKGRDNSYWRRTTHCRQGHEFTPENTRIYGTSRVCRPCMRRYQANARRRVRAMPSSASVAS